MLIDIFLNIFIINKEQIYKFYGKVVMKIIYRIVMSKKHAKLKLEHFLKQRK